jgi:hypothetical protein
VPKAGEVGREVEVREAEAKEESRAMQPMAMLVKG